MATFTRFMRCTFWCRRNTIAPSMARSFSSLPVAPSLPKRGQIIVLRGPSQYGKTSFMNDLTLDSEGPALPVGDGSGESCTETTAMRQTIFGLMLDGPGDNDSRLRFKDEEAGRRYSVAVAEQGGQELKCLVFEALDSPSSTLRPSLSSLVSAFGPSILKCVIVVASRGELVHDDNRRRQRVELIQTIMKERQLEKLVEWRRLASLEEGQQEEQIQQLRLALDTVEGVTPDQLQSLWDRAKERAQELCDNQPKRQVSTEIEQDELVKTTRKVTEKTIQDYIADETYEIEVQNKRNELKTVLSGSAGMLLGAMAGAAAGPVGCFVGMASGASGAAALGHGLQNPGTRTETRTRQVTKQKLVDGKEKEVDEYSVRKGMKTVTMEYKEGPEDFLNAALQQILDEDRKSFADACSS